MIAIPTVEESEIRTRVGDQSFERGRGYFQNDALFNTRRQGASLKARCQGTAEEPYRVEVTFRADAIASAQCTCPVGHGGHCKHVAALLLAWRERPEDFVEIEDLDEALEKRSKSELVGLVKQMVKRAPDLDRLLELPLPNGRRRSSPVSPEVFRRQATAAFRRVDLDQWGSARIVADELTLIGDIGAGFARQGDLASAAAVYGAIAPVVIEHYEHYSMDGALDEVVVNCVDRLAELLEQAHATASEREPILRALFDVYRSNLDEAPDFALALNARNIILERASPSEKSLVASWLRSAILANEEGLDVTDEGYSGFLFDLESDFMDDETFMQGCRQLGRTEALIDHLLSLGRIDEASAEIRQAADYRVVSLADRFVVQGYSEFAECLLAERAVTSTDESIPVWLRQRASERGEFARALRYAERVFQLRPSLAAYEEVRALAQRLGNWDDVRPLLRSALAQGQRPHLLVEVYLSDGEIDRAIDAIRTTATSDRSSSAGFAFGYGFDLRLEVARAAEATRPRAARDIYRERAEQLISLRGRGNYQVAAQLLAKVKALSLQLNEAADWYTEIGNLRQQYRHLRALQQELTAAGL